MGKWVVTVAGIAILSVLCDVILPEGQTRKYIKTVVGVIVTLVMLQPIVNLVGNAKDLSTLSSKKSDMIVQQSYLDMVEDKQIELHCAAVKNMLTAKNISVKNIDVNKTDKTVVLQIDEKQSDKVRSDINSAVSVYFKNYQITIKWK